MDPRDLLEALLGLAEQAKLEVRVLSASTGGHEFRPEESSACRVGERVWVVLAPDDPAPHQARVLADALRKFRPEVLETTFVAPGVRDFVESGTESGR
jgi:hypothetical protein